MPRAAAGGRAGHLRKLGGKLLGLTLLAQVVAGPEVGWGSSMCKDVAEKVRRKNGGGGGEDAGWEDGACSDGVGESPLPALELDASRASSPPASAQRPKLRQCTHTL